MRPTNLIDAVNMIKSSRASPWEAAEGASAVSKQVNKTTNQSMKLSENSDLV